MIESWSLLYLKQNCHPVLNEPVSMAFNSDLYIFCVFYRRYSCIYFVSFIFCAIICFILISKFLYFMSQGPTENQRWFVE